MSHSREIIDGCTAATHIAYALSDIATIYPITPIASMGETAQKWAIAGRKNVFGQTMEVHELESELGAAGATHGAFSAGALATTFTASQGLLLMIPNMFKISGELLPGVFHVGTRSIATHALSIFGDHQDVMACRSTGFTMIASASVQETMDLALVAHLSAIEASLPVLHFFDGWRTSNEMSSVEMIDYDSIAPLVNMDKVSAFRRRGMNPEHPDVRGTAQDPDVYFQNREAANAHYAAFPAIVQEYMNKVATITGRSYNLVDYVGAPDADRVIVALGSACEVVEETISYLNVHGYKVGLVKVRLYRPFPAKELTALIPATAKVVAVLNRTKEPGAQGEPLYQDVVTAIHSAGSSVKVINGRYGLSSKDFNPSMVKAVYDEMAKSEPMADFTVGINDDVTHLSLDVTDSINTAPAGMIQCQFYGMGSDGTVGATKQAAHILADNSDMYVQAYFDYSAKKSGGYTVSQLRLDKNPIKSEYAIENADFIGCNKDTYVRRFDVLGNIKPGGTFVLNSAWTLGEMERALPAAMRRKIARQAIKFYNIDAVKIAAQNGLGVRINVIMETVFLKLIGIVPFDTAITHLKSLVQSVYMHEGGDVVQKNLQAIDAAVAALTPVEYPASWADAVDEPTPAKTSLPDFITRVAQPCNERRGDSLPVSALSPDGFVPMGTTAYEKRGIAINIPEWIVDKCVECTECSLVCAHAAIRPYVITPEEQAAAPSTFISKEGHGSPEMHQYRYRIQVYPDDCTGCGSCAVICPGDALTMVPIASQLDVQRANLAYAQAHVTIKDNILPRNTINGSQLQQPLLEFSGACGGCGETPYIKLLTQLFGERMLIANATGCSSIWGANMPSTAYCVNKDGHGPAWANSLFEDNAEYGFGIALAVQHRRQLLANHLRAYIAAPTTDKQLVAAANAWLATPDSVDAAKALTVILSKQPDSPEIMPIKQSADLIIPKSVWAIGGDGWAYDIGFAGLDHVIASGENINIFVMDTECYSNTGGQTSKATPLGAVTKYSPDGKRTYKKDLGRMAMTYGNVYVASICLGADYQQTINAMVEAEAYNGPSLIIAYCPCINHGIRAGMGHDIVEEREAVKSGYWQLYRYNPDLAKQGKNPLTVDYQAPDGQLIPFINGEDRYADLKMVDPNEAAVLQPELKSRCDELYKILTS